MKNFDVCTDKIPLSFLVLFFTFYCSGEYSAHCLIGKDNWLELRVLQHVQTKKLSTNSPRNTIEHCLMTLKYVALKCRLCDNDTMIIDGTCIKFGFRFSGLPSHTAEMQPRNTWDNITFTPKFRCWPLNTRRCTLFDHNFALKKGN